MRMGRLLVLPVSPISRGTNSRAFGPQSDSALLVMGGDKHQGRALGNRISAAHNLGSHASRLLHCMDETGIRLDG